MRNSLFSIAGDMIPNSFIYADLPEHHLEGVDVESLIINKQNLLSLLINFVDFIIVAAIELLDLTLLETAVHLIVFFLKNLVLLRGNLLKAKEEA